MLFLFLALVLPPKNNLFLLAVVLLNDNPLPPLTTTDAMAPDVACMCVSFSFFPGFSIRSLLRGGKEGGKCTARGESVSSFILGARAIFFQLQETRSSHHSVQGWQINSRQQLLQILFTLSVKISFFSVFSRF